MKKFLPARTKPARIVFAPCFKCHVVHKLSELVRAGLNGRKVYLCSKCLDD